MGGDNAEKSSTSSYSQIQVIEESSEAAGIGTAEDKMIKEAYEEVTEFKTIKDIEKVMLKPEFFNILSKN